MSKFSDNTASTNNLGEDTDNSDARLSNLEIVDENLTTDIEKAKVAKETGNDFFRKKNFQESIEYYSQAIYYCPKDELYKEILSTFYGNRSAAFFSEEEFDAVIDDCNSALELKPDYIKVLFRRMNSYEKLDRIEDALNGIIIIIRICKRITFVKLIN
jgi:tetratricopeptide (TPR) repeat protein